jgi:Antibiotic biosynthesis monooxygenase
VIGIVATIKVKPGMEKEFEAVAKELVAKVNANEPGCMLYAITTRRLRRPTSSWSAMPTRLPWMPIGERSISRSSGVRWASSWKAGPMCCGFVRFSRRPDA